MLWTIACVLMILWLLGLVSGFTVGSFIHILMLSAIALMLVSLIREFIINRKLRQVLRSRDYEQDNKRRYERLTDRPIPSRITP